MSEQLKFIVQELNKEPFNKTYNLISFDNLEPLHVLQVLSDVLTECEGCPKIDVRDEQPDQMTMRLLQSIKILKYKPPTSISGSDFKNKLVSGQKLIIYPILEHILRNFPEMRKRAYLGQYLVRVEVPHEFRQDDQIIHLLPQYESLLEEFKEAHRQAEEYRNSGFNTKDIKNDIRMMEEEKDQLIKRVERMKRKVEVNPNSLPMMEKARQLRQERDKEEKLLAQKQDQKSLIKQMENRIQRIKKQLDDVRKASLDVTVEGLISKLEEENKVNLYMVKDKLPKEVSMRNKIVQDMQRIASEPAMGQADLDTLRAKLRETNADINQLLEKQLKREGEGDDKAMLFRQQAAIVSRKKEAGAEKLQEAREELAQLETEVEEKRAKLNIQGGGETMMRADEFKKYVAKLRSKSTTYKKRRQEMSELKAECGVLARTEEILKDQSDSINSKLDRLETKHGVSGLRETQEKMENVSSQKSEVDSMKGKTLEDISHMVQKLNKKINEKKSALAPIVKELRPLREESQVITCEHEEKKGKYDTMKAGLESNSAKLEKEVRMLKDEVATEESRIYQMKSMIRFHHIYIDRANQELKMYTVPDSKTKTFKEIYAKKIQEQETVGKNLREEQKGFKDNQGNNQKIVSMWKDFNRIIEKKLEICGRLDRQIEPNKSKDEERLVL